MTLKKLRLQAAKCYITALYSTKRERTLELNCSHARDNDLQQQLAVLDLMEGWSPAAILTAIITDRHQEQISNKNLRLEFGNAFQKKLFLHSLLISVF